MAGERIVFSVDDRLRVVEPSGRVRAFGVPTEDLGGFITDEHRILWFANGCLLIDQASAPAARAPGKGPCPRSEINFDNDQPEPRLAHTLPIVLGCVAAPRNCTGSFHLITADNPGVHVHQISKPQRFSIPAGHRRRYQVRLTERGYRELRRNVHQEEGGFAGVEARTDDGDRLAENQSSSILVRP